MADRRERSTVEEKEVKRAMRRMQLDIRPLGYAAEQRRPRWLMP